MRAILLIPCTLLLWLTPEPARSQTPAADPSAPTSPSSPIPPAPVLPTVEDPMLAPVPPAPVQVESWDQARTMLEEGSSDLRIAAANVDAAHGRWRQALSALLPSGRASASVAYDILNPKNPAFAGGGVGGGAAGGGAIIGGLAGSGGASPSVPLGIANVSISQPLVDLSGWAGLGAANAQERSAEASEDDLRRRVTLGLANTVVVVVTGERIAEVARVSLRQALERQALTERLVALGVAIELDAVRVRQDVAVAKSALIASDEQLRVSREALGDLLGIDGEVGVSSAFTMEDVVQESGAACEALPSIEERADVLAARAAAEAAEATRRQALAGYLPRLDANTQTFALTTDPGLGRWATWSVGAVLSIPLWEGGLREGQLQERAALAARANEQVRQVSRLAAIEQDRVRRSEAAAAAVVASSREARELAAQLDQLTRRSYEMGRANSLDLVQTAIVLRQAELELALRESDWVQRRLEAYFTLARCPA